MVVSSLRVCKEQSPYIDCEVVLSEPAEAASTVTCINASTGTIIGVRQLAPLNDATISAEEVIRMIGGAYRLASIAVDLETDLLMRQTRRVSDLLRNRRRLWRRRYRGRA